MTARGVKAALIEDAAKPATIGNVVSAIGLAMVIMGSVGSIAWRLGGQEAQASFRPILMDKRDQQIAEHDKATDQRFEQTRHEFDSLERRVSALESQRR